MWIILHWLDSSSLQFRELSCRIEEQVNLDLREVLSAIVWANCSLITALKTTVSPRRELVLQECPLHKRLRRAWKMLLRIVLLTRKASLLQLVEKTSCARLIALIKIAANSPIGIPFLPYIHRTFLCFSFQYFAYLTWKSKSPEYWPALYGCFLSITFDIHDWHLSLSIVSQLE